MTDFTARHAALTSEPSRDVAGDPARLARVERTRTEMMAQGAALRATLAATMEPVAALADRLASRPLGRIVVTGCGDSWFVGQAVRHALERLTGLPVEGAQALDYAAYGAGAADEGTLVLGLSSGGNTPAVMSALQAARTRGAFAVGISNTPGSPVLQSFDAGLVVHATRKGWPTQASTSAMGLLVSLGFALAAARGRSIDADLAAGFASLPDRLDALASALDGAMRAAAEDLARASVVFFTGLGPNLATANFGAAKVRELCPVHAMAIPLEEIHHYRLPKRGDALVIVATDPAARERALDTVLVGAGEGARMIALLAGPDEDIDARVAHPVLLPALDPALAPFVASVPLHLLAYHLAHARERAGLGYPGLWAP